MLWFVIGAAVGVANGLRIIITQGANYPWQGLLASTALGALVFGTPLWVLAKIFS
jgi:hypothetical protein